MTVGEAYGVRLDDAEKWVGEENGYFNMIFQFEHIGLWNTSLEGGLDLAQFKQTLTRWQKGLEGRGWNALFFENHDHPRSVSAWGNDTDLRITSAKALATLYFFMQGTPFIYQGQEIGMTNVQFDSIDDYDDVNMKNYYKIQLAEGKSHEEIMQVIWKNGRDNSRTPMQWTSEPQAGFTTGTPWMKVNPNYPDINVEQNLNDPNSIYHYYRTMIELRKSSETLIYGAYDLVAGDHEQVYAYTRTLGDDRYVVIVNIFNEATTLDLSNDMTFVELQLSNYRIHDELNANMELRPYEARVYKIK